MPARPQRWLDLSSLCRSYLHHFGRSATLQGIYSFSALARHLAVTNHDIEARHTAYIEGIRSTGVQVTPGSFKARDKYILLTYWRLRIWRWKRPVRLPIPRCSLVYTRAEEKETEVAIASRMFELLHRQEADAIVRISGDTDLLPAIRTARSLFPAARIVVMFPYNRHNAELKRAAPIPSRSTRTSIQSTSCRIPSCCPIDIRFTSPQSGRVRKA